MNKIILVPNHTTIDRGTLYSIYKKLILYINESEIKSIFILNKLLVNTKYDKIADALYVKFKQGKIAKTLRLENHLIVDLDSKSNILGVELLNAKSQLAPSFVKQFLRKRGLNSLLLLKNYSLLYYK